MNLKNINETKKIIKKNISQNKIIGGGIIIFTLGVTLFTQDIIYDSEEYNYYNAKYMENLITLNDKDFDYDFYQLYDNIKYSYNNINYGGKSLYIVEYNDGSIHLVDSNNSKEDLFTQEIINAKKTNIVLFKESSIFYELYKNGLIDSNEVILSNEYIDIIKNWDGKKHYKTPDLIAQKNALEEYELKYGGR